jgi:hypothetical protein
MNAPSEFVFLLLANFEATSQFYLIHLCHQTLNSMLQFKLKGKMKHWVEDKDGKIRDLLFIDKNVFKPLLSTMGQLVFEDIM